MEAFGANIGSVGECAGESGYIQAIVFMGVIIVVQSVFIWMLIACSCSSMIRSTCMFCTVPLVVALGAVYFHDVIRDAVGIPPPIRVDETGPNQAPPTHHYQHPPKESRPQDSMSFDDAMQTLKANAQRWWTFAQYMSPIGAPTSWLGAFGIDIKGTNANRKEPIVETHTDEEGNIHYSVTYPGNPGGKDGGL